MLDSDQELRQEIGNAFPGVFGADRGGLEPAACWGGGSLPCKERLERLNGIVFRHMEPELRRRLANNAGGLVAIDAISLLEGGLDQMCDRTIALTAPLELRVRGSWPGTTSLSNMPGCGSPHRSRTSTTGSGATLELNNAAESAAAFEAEAQAVLLPADREHQGGKSSWKRVNISG